ncbi:TonB family protein [Erythrobacter vulgaris]|uniref:TonB family protein n=1 Tax=Qipengyuania vulgaris TaxID=291985 RepID=A0A844XT10_9SPHN|nr:energy transducer TonB [Qipengyuania vulgaris]MXO48148.1 TonB family protein [Qipengyuania vulgaris]
MAYADQQMSGNRVIAIIIVALIHIALGYLLITGLAVDAVQSVVERVTTIDVEEPPPPEPEDEPPPPPEDIPETAPPPPVAPPPPINIAPAPPPLRTTPTIPPPAPPTLRIPPPAPPAPPAPRPAPPSQARGASPDGLGRWAARIQGDYPSSALRREEQGTVTMRITIGANGRVEACSVTGSSGSSALDDAACRGMQRYARYNPALNAAGNPISDTTTQSIRYVLPD